MPDQPTADQKIGRYEAWPGWRHIPRFVELAEAKPDDEAAFRCCQWIIDCTGNVGNRDKTIFAADQKAWEILAAHHTRRPDLPMLCLQAIAYFGPAREQFLRGLLKRQDLVRDSIGFATVALAELLAREYEYIETFEPDVSQDEYARFIEQRRSPEWGKDLIAANASKIKGESVRLFRDVLARYADVPITISAPYFRDLKNLGEKTGKSLHALEHLTIGAESPDIAGQGLDGRLLSLRNHRGSVVVITFWFTGCGPCMGLIPQERRLIEAYKGQRFALLSVCADESLEQAKKTAVEHKMDWPCWFDGENGPIARDWNAIAWPTIYVIDKDGRIAAKNLEGEKLDGKVASLRKDAK